MKKSFKVILILLLLFLLVGCNLTKTPQQYVITIEYNNGDYYNEIIVEEGKKIVIEEEVSYEGYEFKGWYLDEQLTIPLTSDYVPTSDITIYAKWEKEKIKILFYVGDEIYDEQILEDKGYAIDPGDPYKEGYTFLYWSTSKKGDIKLNFSKKISKSTNIYAHFVADKFVVTFDLEDGSYQTKYDLYVDFFTDFYNFMIENTDVNFSKLEITNLNQFLEFCLNWNSNGKDSFYGVGDAFSKYYVTIDIGGTLENQPETTFIGHCYKNNKYTEFIPFLMQFFAYWRTDEGYTGGESDPQNLGNDFFASPWASLVDTCKFFYFTSENLNDTYPWFTSQRVKEALDKVPTVNYEFRPMIGTIEQPVIFKTPEREGYIFLGWYDELGNKVTEANKEMSVTAKWEKIIVKK